MKCIAIATITLLLAAALVIPLGLAALFFSPVLLAAPLAFVALRTGHRS